MTHYDSFREMTQYEYRIKSEFEKLLLIFCEIFNER